jgi:hypothetical protein
LRKRNFSCLLNLKKLRPWLANLKPRGRSTSPKLKSSRPSATKQLSLIRRAASIECELERLDAMLSTGAEVNLDAYGRAASHLRRLFETLGVGRKARDVTLGGSVEVLEPPLSPMRSRWAAEAAEAAK